MDDGDPHDEIVLLEAQIEALADKLESCRKFILASRIAMAGGGVMFLAILLGLVPFDAAAMTASVAALIGGIVGWGSNHSTARQAREEIAAAEARRAVLIGLIDPRLVPGSATLH